MVVEHAQNTDHEGDIEDRYWEGRWTIGDHVPEFLEGQKEKVLRCGKYLNVVRECGGVIDLDR